MIIGEEGTIPHKDLASVWGWLVGQVYFCVYIFLYRFTLHKKFIVIIFTFIQMSYLSRNISILTSPSPSSPFLPPQVLLPKIQPSNPRLSSPPSLPLHPPPSPPSPPLLSPRSLLFFFFFLPLFPLSLHHLSLSLLPPHMSPHMSFPLSLLSLFFSPSSFPPPFGP